VKDKGLLKKLLLGLGLDCKDGIWRVTSGKNFRLFGGSEQTHEEMQEKAIKLNEHLDRKKKSLDEISMQEFMDIAEKIEMFKQKSGGD